MLSEMLDREIESAGGKPKEVLPTIAKKSWKMSFGAVRFDKQKIRRFFSRESVLALQDEGKTIMSMVSFFGLLLLFLLEIFWKAIGKIVGLRRVVASANAFWNSRAGGVGERIVNSMESRRGGVRRSFLIALAFRNMRAKKTRSFVTVGGMSLGIAAIVFLVSVGYGLQRLVVSRVARLEELKMADVTIAQAANIKIDPSAVTTMENIPGVEKVMPIVSLVGKIKFEGGVSESVVYGVTGDYLTSAGLNKVKGEFFENQQASAKIGEGRVAGESTEWKFESATKGKMIKQVAFNVESEAYLRVRESASTDSAILGYVRRVEGGYEGVEYWGEEYSGDTRGREGKDAKGQVLGRWIKAPYPLWVKQGSEYVPLYDSERVQEWREGYIAEIQVEVDEEKSTYIQWDDVTAGAVLGEATGSAQITTAESSPESSISATIVGRDENGVEWVTLGEDATESAQAAILMIETPDDMQKEAVVNKAFVELLGLDINEAVGSTFEIGFVILNTLKPDLDRPAESIPEKYIIRSVVSEGSSPIVYVPLSDITGLGITNYSQAKLVAKTKEDLGKVRQQVDNLGYKTSSVADTVEQIDKLFGTARVVLATFGMVALAVASLGMFNTLTVSLMERTREVGIMKAMGMQSSEVKELFLAEAMVMGILGGIFGVTGGFVAGKLLGVILSAFSIAKGVGWIDISYIPPIFVAFVLVLSFIVGVVTGLYPARRATKISALNALRYE